MRPFKAIAIFSFLMALATSALGQQSQNPQPAFWESGNVFLQYCDESNPYFAELPGQSKQMLTVVCNSWIVGIRQGIEITQQIRPESPSPTPSVSEQNKERAEYLQKILGPGAAVSTPRGNMCIPSDATPNQLRLVVVQWMKANPTKVGDHGAWLVYAALTNTYACPSEKEKQP